MYGGNRWLVQMQGGTRAKAVKDHRRPRRAAPVRTAGSTEQSVTILNAYGMTSSWPTWRALGLGRRSRLASKISVQRPGVP